VRGVVFQDFNEEVLSLWTLLNLGLSLKEGFRNRVGFIRGDWKELEDLNSVNGN
jgi:hypothetical protein